jgi:hypoxanthine phosphoribosyltransferase
VTAAAPLRPSFAHASEAELARILDFYEVQWRYEPDTYPIGWNLDGDVVESFSPDFYLPDMELYVELTTLKQKLVRKKNRKLRRLRQLYPDIRIKLFYARDFRMLMLKFGRMALLDDMTGTTGQSTPPRPHDPAVSAPQPPVLTPLPALTTPAAGRAVPDPVVEADAAGRSAADGEPDTQRDPSSVRRRRRGRRHRRVTADAAALPAGTLVAPVHDARPA